MGINCGSNVRDCELERRLNEPGRQANRANTFHLILMVTTIEAVQISVTNQSFSTQNPTG